MESDLIPYTSCLCIDAHAVLVLAPHPDDEVFGCGGAIVGHVNAGQRVCVVILTDGAVFGDAAVRQLESQAAAAVLGYGAPEFWAFPDRGLAYSEELVQRLVNKIAASCSDLVYAPSPWEVHPDHRQASMVAVEAVRRAGQTVRLAFYEIGAPLRPNLLLDITSTLAIKEAAMRCFPSQLEHQDYTQHIQALNRYRTYTLPRNVAAAEAFCVLNALELEGFQYRGQWLPVSFGVLAECKGEKSDFPLVSILIRSLDRVYLAQALDSIALQTYPAIEVVVVAALPDHNNVAASCGSFPIRFVRTDVALPRSRAANTAMASAEGKLLLILDDDDWLMPGHIARLVQVLERQPHALAAYTGVALVDSCGKSLGQAIDLPFDAVRQLAGNLTPIHAVMFRASVIDRGCRFDETLDLYEDWDFWLQLSALAPMVHLPGSSAVYRIHESSGVHSRDGSASLASFKVQQNWSLHWTAEQLGQIMGRVWSYPELSANLNDSRRALEDSQRGLSEAREGLLETIRKLTDSLHHLAQTRTDLAQATGEVSFLNQKLAFRDEQQTQSGLVADAQNKLLSDYQEQAKHLALQLDEQQQANTLLQQQVQETAQSLALELERAEFEDAALRASWSWRIARPLRWVESLTRKADKA